MFTKTFGRGNDISRKKPTLAERRMVVVVNTPDIVCVVNTPGTVCVVNIPV